METESFDVMRRRVLSRHKHLIVRSARRGHRDKGRGLVMVRFKQTGKSGTVHLSYLTLAALKRTQDKEGLDKGGYRDLIIEKVSTYYPDLQIPVLVTDGVSEEFMFGVRKTL
jgi:hypothetical protein